MPEGNSLDNPIFISEDGFMVIERKNGDVYVNNHKGENRGFTYFANKTSWHMGEHCIPPRSAMVAMHGVLVRFAQSNRKQSNTINLLFFRWDNFDQKMYISVEFPEEEKEHLKRRTHSFEFDARGIRWFDDDQYDEEAEKTLNKCKSEDDPKYYKLHDGNLFGRAFKRRLERARKEKLETGDPDGKLEEDIQYCLEMIEQCYKIIKD